MTLLSSRGATAKFMQAKIMKAASALDRAYECLDDRECEEAFAEAKWHLDQVSDHTAKAKQAYHDWIDCEETAKREREEAA